MTGRTYDHLARYEAEVRELRADVRRTRRALARQRRMNHTRRDYR